jgi:hypothetical protein
MSGPERPGVPLAGNAGETDAARTLRHRASVNSSPYAMAFLKTAKALGLDVSPMLLALADDNRIGGQPAWPRPGPPALGSRTLV